MHGLVDSRMLIICTLTRHRGCHSSGRRGADRQDLRRQGGLDPWRRPGFQLGLDIAKIKADNPQAIGCILGGHGITRAIRQRNDDDSLEIIRTAEAYIAEHSKPEPFGALSTVCRTAERATCAKPHSHRHCGRSRRSTSRWWGISLMTSGCWSSYPAANIPGWPNRAPAAPTISCGPRSSRWYLIFPADASVEDSIARLGELHEAYRADYQAYYERHATSESPPIRGADPLIILVPGVGMFSCRKDKQTARVAGEFYLNAINVMRGAEGLSTYAPIDESEKFKIEYRALEEAKAAHAEAQAARHPDCTGHRQRGQRQGDCGQACRRGCVRGHW